MVKKVGLTGGIGSGKTTVAKLLLSFGYPVYFTDSEAKKLMNTDDEIVRLIIQLLGTQAYSQGQLNRAYVADQVFENKKLLSQLNDIVHPFVARHFKQWCLMNDNCEVVFQESAIIFENGSESKFDKVILVTAPQDIRLERVIKRDNQNEQSVRARMDNQWCDSKKATMADFVIKCDGKNLVIPQILNVLKQI